MHIAASTLYDFVQCPTRVALDAFGDATKRDPISPFLKLLWERGKIFERGTIAKLEQPFTDLSGILQGRQSGRPKAVPYTGDERAPIHDIQFFARAWQLANTKAKELGWVA